MTNAKRHDKFKKYWEDRGKPELECAPVDGIWSKVKRNPAWYDNLDYRLSDDIHWQLRKKWIDSEKTLPLEVYLSSLRRWTKVTGCPLFLQDRDYRELIEEVAEPIQQEEVKADLLKPYMREIAMLTAYDEACKIAPFLTTKEGLQGFAMAFKMGCDKYGKKYGEE